MNKNQPKNKKIKKFGLPIIFISVLFFVVIVFRGPKDKKTEFFEYGNVNKKKNEKNQAHIKILAFSDTHGKLTFKVPNDIDLLLFLGDMTNGGGIEEFRNFNAWMKRVNLPKEKKVVIGGNHECNLKLGRAYTKEEMTGFLDCCTYLENDSYDVKFEESKGKERKLSLYGTNWFPNMHKELVGRAKVFPSLGSKTKLNLDNDYIFRDEEFLEKEFRKIPKTTDILMTHIPPNGILDYDYIQQKNVGSYALRKIIDENLENLQLVLFGHIHNSPGNKYKKKNTYNKDDKEERVFFNVAMYDDEFKPVIFNYYF